MNNSDSDVEAILDIPRPADINDRQWRFVLAVARPGSTGKSAAIEAGYSDHGGSPDVKAATLLGITKIREAVDMVAREYQRMAVKATLDAQQRYSRDWVLSQLSQNVEIGRSSSGQLSASNRALELIAKGVHPGFMDRGDGGGLTAIESVSFTMNIGSASGDDSDDLDVIEGSSVPILDEPDDPGE